jgi:hypothetical protein
VWEVWEVWGHLHFPIPYSLLAVSDSRWRSLP